MNKIFKTLLILGLCIIPSISSAEEHYTILNNEETIETLLEGESVKNNTGTINTNNGHVENNRGSIRVNKGTITNNFSYNLLDNQGILINDFIHGQSDRNNNAQNKYYNIEIDKYYVDITWYGKTDENGNYYYGDKNNQTQEYIGASFKVVPKENYILKDIEIDNGTLTKLNDNTYKIELNKNSASIISITTDYTNKIIFNKGGKIKLIKENPIHYDNLEKEFEYEIEVEDGYELKDVLVDGESKGKIYTYKFTTMKPVTIEAIFRKAPEPPKTNAKSAILAYTSLLIASIYLFNKLKRC